MSINLDGNKYEHKYTQMNDNTKSNKVINLICAQFALKKKALPFTSASKKLLLEITNQEHPSRSAHAHLDVVKVNLSDIFHHLPQDNNSACAAFLVKSVS